MEYLPLIIQLASGALGGNLAGKAMPKFSMGTLLNSILGIVGGGLGGSQLGNLGIDLSSGMDLAGIISSVASGGVGGGVVMAIIGLIKNAISK